MAYAPFDLSGKVALITGGNSGIGLGMARALAEAGADIAIWGSNPAKNAAALENLKPLGVRLYAAICDISDEAAVETAFAETVEKLGRVDACFANAGTYGHASRFTALETAEWQRVMRINLDGAFYTLRAAARHMVERGGGGSLVVTASLAAIEGAARNAHYGATKGALVAMIRALAVELARHGIRANAILPGWIETAMTAGNVADERFSGAVLPRIPARRWGQPADFAGIAVYLASDASAYHSGDCLVIDGGYSLF
ncbi:MAG: SDR family oxidoreductase [Roseomonas sp.]|nr:SDR family oxidoreductase [Roseomonas sp.]